MPERNSRQAMVIEDAEVLPNPNGTAPGMFIDH
jgi:nicotinamide-nucleotide amidase